MKDLMNEHIFLIQSGLNTPALLLLAKSMMAAALTLAFQFWKQNTLDIKEGSS